MKKIIIFVSKIQHYREPLFNLIAKEYDLTIVQSEKEYVNFNNSYKVLYIKEKNKLGFILHDNIIFNEIKKYDVAICLFNLRNLSLMMLSLLKKNNTKIIYWGIGVSASTKNDSYYDKNKRLDIFRRFFLKKADAAIFYCEYPKDKYVKLGIIADKLFIEPNTIIYKNKNIICSKCQILFIGSVYKAKGIDILIKYYHEAYKLQNNIPDLVVIGEGDERSNLEFLVNKIGLSNKVIFKGAIYDSNLLASEFSKSYAVISPNQAGLAVLSSFANSVPFITHFNAITGGERFNIINDYNGNMYYSDIEIKNYVLDIYNNRDKYIKMGENAKQYYDSIRSKKSYGINFIKAIKYTLKDEN